MTLDEMPLGTSCVVEGILESDFALKKKLLSLGFVQGTEITPLKRAPLGDPMTVRVMGSTLALRLCEAAVIRVSP